MDKMRTLYLHTAANAHKTIDPQPSFHANHIALLSPSKKYTRMPKMATHSLHNGWNGLRFLSGSQMTNGGGNDGLGPLK